MKFFYAKSPRSCDSETLVWKKPRANFVVYLSFHQIFFFFLKLSKRIVGLTTLFKPDVKSDSKKGKLYGRPRTWLEIPSSFFMHGMEIFFFFLAIVILRGHIKEKVCGH